MTDILLEAADRARRYLDSLNTRSVAPGPEAVSGLSALSPPLPEDPVPAKEVLKLLDEAGSPATQATAGGRFFGFVIGGCLPAALAANWLAGAWDQNAFSRASSPLGAAVEETALSWLLEILNLPPGSGGAFVTGATMANFTALAAARHRVLEKSGWDAEADGLFGAPPINVVLGEEAHPTVFKSLGLLGLGRRRVKTVPVDGQGRMRPEALPELNPETIVCLQAGNVNTGAFDPAAEICLKAREAGAWVHVDGAFGLWAAASPKLSGLAKGVELADSWATDGHKWLNVPYDCGLAFVRDPEPLRKAMSISASYLPMGESREPCDFTPEASRRARGIEVWAALMSLGRRGLADMIEGHCRQAAYLAEELSRAGHQILNQVVLNQVLVSFGDGDKTSRVIEAVQKDGTCWCGGTVWQGRPAMRISLSSWATTDEDVSKALEAILRLARES